MRIFINSRGCPRSTAMILVFQGRTFPSKTKYSTSKADVTERLEDANLNGLDEAIVSTGAHSNTTGTHGRVSIGVQAGFPSVTSSGTWDLKQMDNEAETRGTGVSIGVDARQQMGGKIGLGSFFEGGEPVSIIIMKSTAPYTWI